MLVFLLKAEKWSSISDAKLSVMFGVLSVTVHMRTPKCYSMSLNSTECCQKVLRFFLFYLMVEDFKTQTEITNGKIAKQINKSVDWESFNQTLIKSIT